MRNVHAEFRNCSTLAWKSHSSDRDRMSKYELHRRARINSLDSSHSRGEQTSDEMRRITSATVICDHSY
jgi:hypothetical protein